MTRCQILAVPALATTILAGHVATDASAAVLAVYDFSDAPLVAEARALPVNRTSAVTSADTGIAASDFQVVLADTSNSSVVIATDGGTGAHLAQLSNLDNSAFDFANGPFAEFTLENVLALDTLEITARGGWEWDGDNNLSSQGGRFSDMVVRTSLDSFTTDLGSVFQPGTGTDQLDWDTEILDLSGLDLGGATTITFRLSTRKANAGSGFHRTQMDLVQVTGTAVPPASVIPEPGSAALLALCGLVLLRRRHLRKRSLRS